MTQEQDELIEKNINLAHWFVSHKTPKWMRCNAELREELRSAALRGLLDAARTYNPDHESGSTFGTYAYRCIALRISAVKKALNLKRELVFKGASRIAQSEEEWIGSPGVYMPVCEHPLAEVDLFSNEKLRWALALLPKQHRLILRARFEIDSDFKTLSELGKPWNLTRERVRQLQYEAIWFLRQVFMGVEEPKLVKYKYLSQEWVSKTSKICYKVLDMSSEKSKKRRKKREALKNAV